MWALRATWETLAQWDRRVARAQQEMLACLARWGLMEQWEPQGFQAHLEYKVHYAKNATKVSQHTMMSSSFSKGMKGSKGDLGNSGEFKSQYT